MSYIRPLLLDSSALIKFILPERQNDPGGDTLRSIINNSISPIYVHKFCQAECFVRLKWMYKYKEIDSESYDYAIYLLINLFKMGRLIYLEKSEADYIDSFEALAVMKSANFEIDMVDALQVVEIGEGYLANYGGPSTAILVTTDQNLCKIASASGVIVWNPTHDEEPPSEYA